MLCNAVVRSKVGMLMLMLMHVALYSTASLSKVSTPVEQWQGESLSKRQGTFYFSVRFDKSFGEPVSTIGGGRTVQVYFYSLLRKKSYVLTQHLPTRNPNKLSLWKLRAGKYRISKIYVVDNLGVRRVWKQSRGTKKKRRQKIRQKTRTFIVKRKSVSNLGVFFMSRKKSKKISVSFKMSRDSFSAEQARRDGTLSFVINGFTGRVQTKISGRSALQSRQKKAVKKSRLEAEYTYSREISMFFKLDLFKHNRFAKKIIKSLAYSDPKFRGCYTDVLQDRESLKGTLKFRFLLSKSTSSMKKLKYAGGSIERAQLVECLLHELDHLNFPVPETMIGELDFSFDVKY